MAQRTSFPARRRPAGKLLALAAVCGLVAGCGSADDSRFTLVVVGAPDDPFQDGPDRPLAAQLTRASTAEGLVAFDEQGRVVPALADRWIVTDDGESYIFRLRDGTWRDGDPLTARSAQAALVKAMRSLRKTPLGLDLTGVEDVRVMAGRVIEVRLARPMPYFLQLLAQPELGLQRGEQGDGPMILERDGQLARFTPIEPSRLGLPQVPDWERRTRRLDMTARPAVEAVRLFNEGLVDLVTGGSLRDFPLTSSVGILRGTIQLDPAGGLFGLRFASEEGFLADPLNREALSMAVDRAALIAPFGLDGWTPATRLLGSGLEGELQGGGERWPGLTPEQRRAAAAERVARWQAAQAGEQQIPTVLVWLPEGPGSDIVFSRLSADWRAIGVATTRARKPEEADLRLVDEVARYPRARWFLNRLSCAARTGLCDPQADAIVADAVALDDPVARATRLREAEERLEAANLFIPFGTPIRWSLVRGNVQGFATNAWAWHPLMPLAWLRK